MERLLKDAEKISGVKYNLESYSDVVEAIHVMQTELDITGTTSREAATTFEGSAKMMKSAWTNVLGAISTGDNVGNAMSNLAESVGIFLFDNFLPMIGNVIKGLPDLIFSIISDGLPNLLDKMEKSLSDFLDKISEKTVKDLSKNGANKLFPALAKLGKQIIKIIINLTPKLLRAGFELMVGFVKGLGDSSVFQRIKETFFKITDKILSPVRSLRDKIKAIVDKIKSFFSFNISFPHIKMPHFSISPSGWKIGDLLKGSIPTLGIDWYAKGGVFDSPSIIGVGEKGSEAVVPLDKFWKRLDNNLQRDIDYNRLGKEVANALDNARIYNMISIDGREVARATSSYMETELNRRSVRENRKLGLV